MERGSNVTDRDFALGVLRLAERAGADAAEVAVTRTASAHIDVQRGAPESVSTKQEAGYGVRVLVDRRIGFTASNRLDLADAEGLVGDAVRLTRLHTPEDANTLPENLAPGGWDPTLDAYDLAVGETPLDRKVARAIAIERMMLDVDPRMKGAAMLVYGDAAEEMGLVNSHGVDGMARSTFAYAFLWAIAQDAGSTETGSDVVASRTYDGLDTELLAHRAAHRALRMLGAKPGRSAEVPVVVPPEVGGDILGYIARMLDADAVQKGKSLFAGREGTQVAAPIVSLVDDGRLPGGLATTFADGEGVPTGRTTLIEGGVLRGFLHDSYTAKKGNTRSTGNAQRGSYRAKPSIGPTNLMLLPGALADDELIAGIDEGLFITDTQALHAAINPASGDFSIPSKGLMIRGGELAEPVTSLAISGNLFDLLRDIDALGSRVEWTVGGGIIGAPTFRARKVRVGSAG